MSLAGHTHMRCSITAVVDDMEMSVAGHSHVKNSVGYHQTDHLVGAVCDLKMSIAGIHV